MTHETHGNDDTNESLPPRVAAVRASRSTPAPAAEQKLVVRKGYEARMRELSERHERLRALAITTAALKESNNKLERSLMLPRGIHPEQAVDALWPEPDVSNVRAQSNMMREAERTRIARQIRYGEDR